MAQISDAPRSIKDDGVENGDDAKEGEKNKEEEEKEEERASEVFASKVEEEEEEEAEEEERGNNESRRQNERPSSERRGSPRKPKRRGILSFPSNLLSRYLWLLAAPTLRSSRGDFRRLPTVSLIGYGFWYVVW